jgi:hypothetical protein
MRDPSWQAKTCSVNDLGRIEGANAGPGRGLCIPDGCPSPNRLIPPVHSNIHSEMPVLIAGSRLSPRDPRLGHSASDHPANDAESAQQPNRR